jgi:predicted AAA+ superfamily ATPase
MLAQYHGCVINYANMANFLDISIPTLKNYLYLLEGTFMIRILLPYFENMGKRLVKTPKLYIRDSGIFHNLCAIANYEQLLLNTKIGASFEGFALEQVTTMLGLRSEECYFWSTHQEAELDLLCILNNKKIGFEMKVTDRPKITKSMHIALETLGLDHLYVVTPIEQTFKLSEKITVLSLGACEKFLGNSAS